MKSEYEHFGATGSESWGETMAAELQHAATEFLDHGDRFENVRKAKIQNHLNIIRNENRDFVEKQNITH